MGRTAGDPAAQLCLPPGFRFFPTDEELVVHYLCRKAAGQQFSLDIIGDIDLYKFDPWLLPGKALFGEKEWYFFSPRDRKYPNGLRPNRVAGSGYWKATGTDKIITVDGRKVGIKKALVFYTGKAPKGIKTNWIMHEYRLAEKSSKTAKKKGSLRLDDWVLCRIYEKNSSTQKTIRAKESAADDASCFDEVLASLPEIDDRFFTLPRISSLKSLPTENLNVQNLSPVKIDWSAWKDQQQPQQPQNQNQHQHQHQHQQPQQQFSNRTTDPDLGAATEIGSRGMMSNMYYSGIPALCQMESPADKTGSLTEEEVQSGLRQQQLDSQMFGQSFSQFLQPYVVSNPNPNLAGIGSFRGDGKFRI